MKMALVGAGACGSVFASYMLRGGADITLVDMYREHMDKVAKDGMEFTIHNNIDGKYVDETMILDGFKTAYNADNIGIMDIVVFVTKATQLDAAVKSVKPCIGENTVLCVLANGFGNDEVLVANHPADHCLYGSGIIGTTMKYPGSCISAPPASGAGLFVGPVVDSEATERAGKYIAECFIKGGMEAKFLPANEISRLVWRKAIHNSGANVMAALTRLSQGAVWANENGRELQSRVIREGCAIAAAKGIEFDVEWFIYDYFAIDMEHKYDLYPSMVYDMDVYKRQTEVTVLNGAIVRMGKELGIPTPTNEVLMLLAKTIQENYAIQIS